MQANIAHEVGMLVDTFPYRRGDLVRIVDVDEFGLLGRYVADDGTTGPTDDDVGLLATVDSLRNESDAGILLLTCTTSDLTRPRKLVLADYEVEYVTR